MQLIELMSGNFSLVGGGTFQNGNVYMQSVVTLVATNAVLSVTVDGVNYPLTNAVTNVDFSMSGGVVHRCDITVTAGIEFDNWTNFMGKFSAS